MLEIRAIMNSSVEEIFNFKTCCGLRIFDQNLEILVRNRGTQPVEVPGYFDLQGEFGSYRVDTLIPSGIQRIMPGEIMAFYCTMDEEIWNASKHLVFYDQEGRKYQVELNDGEV